MSFLGGCAGLAEGFASIDPAVFQQQRDYITNPMYMPTPSATVQSYSQPDQYQNIMISTPNGIVNKRCKVINGNAAYCM